MLSVRGARAAPVLTNSQDSSSLYHQFITALQRDWEVEDEGEVSDLLNVEISREGSDVVLRQVSYIKRMMDTHAPGGCPVSHKASLTPCDDALVRHVADALADRDSPRDTSLVKRYQSLVGALLFAAGHSRPDIAYAVGMLCRAMAYPTADLMDDALRVLYYLHRHRSVGIRYSDVADTLHGYTDSDWGARYSTTGWLFRLGQATISWSSKRARATAATLREASSSGQADNKRGGVSGLAWGGMLEVGGATLAAFNLSLVARSQTGLYPMRIRSLRLLSLWHSSDSRWATRGPSHRGMLCRRLVLPHEHGCGTGAPDRQVCGSGVGY